MDHQQIDAKTEMENGELGQTLPRNKEGEKASKDVSVHDSFQDPAAQEPNIRDSRYEEPLLPLDALIDRREAILQNKRKCGHFGTVYCNSVPRFEK